MEKLSKKMGLFIMVMILSLILCPGFSIHGIRLGNVAEGATGNIIETGTYELVSALASDKVLDISCASGSNKAKLQLYKRNNTLAQKFSIVRGSDGYYTIQAMCSGRMLDVPGSSKVARTAIWQYGSNNTSAQKWSILKNEDDTYSIISKCNGLYMDVDGSKTADGTQIQCYSRNGTFAQKFRLKRLKSSSEWTTGDIIKTGTYELVSALDFDKVLDISCASGSNKAKLQLYKRNNTLAQKFSIVRGSDGYYTIQAMCSGRMLDVPGSSKVARTAIWQYGSNNTGAQRWSILENGDDTYSIVSKCNGLYMDVDRSKTVDGAQIQCYKGNGTFAQKFRLRKLKGSSEWTTENIIKTGTYELVSALAFDKVLDISCAGRSNKTKLQLYKRNNTLAQKFNIVRGDDGYYTIQAVCSGRMLDVSGSSKVARTAVWQYGSNNTNAQKWGILKNGDDTYSIVSKCNGLYMDVDRSKTVDGTQIQCYNGNGTFAQKFRFKKLKGAIVGSGTYELVSALASDKVLDIQCASGSNKAKLQLYTRNNTSAQKFNIVRGDDGYYTIQAVCSGRMLDVPGSSKVAGNAIWQYGRNNTDAQRWNIVRNEDNTYSIFSKCNGLYVDVAGGKNADGAKVQCYKGNGTGAQRFRLRNFPDHWNAGGLNCGSFSAFISDAKRTNSVLILELNPYHHECIPGYAKYFLELGYNVDVLSTSYEGCFDLFDKTDKLRVYTFYDHNQLYYNFSTLSDIVNKYAHVFLNSIETWYRPLAKDLKIFDNPNSLCVAHSTNTVKESCFKSLLDGKRIVTLGRFGVGTYVNPHYFGKVPLHNKNGKTNFVAIGNVRAVHRNYNMLIDSVRKLKAKGLNFKVTVFGRSGKLNVPKELNAYFDFKGSLGYKDMYKEVRNADFILMLLDSNNSSHLCYRTFKVTGNAQLAYGFKKPPIIDNGFAKFYGFNSSNSIIYKENLAAAMEKAIRCSKGEYNDMIKKLESLSNSIFKESLDNLKGMLKYK